MALAFADVRFGSLVAGHAATQQALAHMLHQAQSIKKKQNHSVKQYKRWKFFIHCEGHTNSYYSYFSASHIHLLYYNREV